MTKEKAKLTLEPQLYLLDIISDYEFITTSSTFYITCSCFSQYELLCLSYELSSFCSSRSASLHLLF